MCAYNEIRVHMNNDGARRSNRSSSEDGCSISVVAIGNICYAIGGYKHPEILNQALYASVDDLQDLRNAVPANQMTHSGSKDT